MPAATRNRRGKMAEAKERVFTAAQGVELGDVEDGKYRMWAKFEYAPDLMEPNGPPVYRFATADPKVAERLLGDGCKEYGVTEVTDSAADDGS
jgi:hypothetical protein